MLTTDVHARPSAGPSECEPRPGQGPFRRLLVPVDGSAQSEQPLALALAIARAADADMHLVWVRAPESRYFSGKPEAPSTRMNHLEALREDVTDRLGAPACRAVLAGKPADAIVNHAAETDVDLIVMASRGHGALWRLGVGSTTDGVVRTSPVPVIVMRAPDEEEPSLDQPVRLDDIVVALDGSPAAESTLGPALDLARLMHARVTLLRVVETPVLAVNRGMFGMDMTRESIAVETRLAQTYLDHIADRVRAGGSAVETAVEEASTAGAGILRFARDIDADLVAIGTQGVGRASILRGTTAARLFHDSDVPLLVTNPGTLGARA